ncbi:MAG: SDR family NAD(P)-dependent oxidoreductase [Puniceicoccales bacterium]|jgi:NAD(P)-dependent dehydrogenase (short-subunit alcohol dehydrogenase family)|nr:SDR family NAD(P)-dependent oxidoreductase [Puniceicoccales bacterium]
MSTASAPLAAPETSSQAPLPAGAFPYREALVTGASGGLGRAFALALLAAGVRVHGTSRSGAGLPAGVIPHALDLAHPSSVAALVAELRRDAPALDLLINNAGSGLWQAVCDLGDAEISESCAILLEGPVRLCRAFHPRFAEQGHGAIVNVTSLAGVFPIPCMSLYCAAKAGLSAFTRTLMLEASGSGVVILDFQPGDYRTGFNENMRKAHLEPAGERRGAAHSGNNFRDAARDLRAWECCEAHLRDGPPPRHAAKALMRALRHGRSGTVVTGTFFQAVLGLFLARFLPSRLIHRFLRAYYRL